MSDVVSTFPLLRLPKNAILCTFRTMSNLKTFGISLLSKKVKNLVKSLKMKGYTFQVDVTHIFQVYVLSPNSAAVLSFQLYCARENQPPKKIGTPRNIYSVGFMWRVKWANSMSVKQILDHLRVIFHNPTTIVAFGPNSERFSLEAIWKNVNDFENIRFYGINHTQNRRILNVFQPASLTLGGFHLRNGCISRDILIQNFDLIRVPHRQINLNDLLMTNALSVKASGFKFSEKILNKFLKLWVKGSNPRLEYVCLRLRNNFFQTEEFLRGLSYKFAPLDRVRLFKNSSEKRIVELAGGWDISRLDGTKATIAVGEGHSVVFQFFVWHDHCFEAQLDL